MNKTSDMSATTPDDIDRMFPEHPFGIHETWILAQMIDANTNDPLCGEERARFESMLERAGPYWGV